MALYISLPMCTWNLSGSSQLVRSMREVWGMSGLALESFQRVRSANFVAQTSLLLMLAARAAKVPALWCHPSPVEGELCPSLWHLPEVQWTLKAGAFATDRNDSCTFWVPEKGPCHCNVHQPPVCWPDGSKSSNEIFVCMPASALFQVCVWEGHAGTLCLLGYRTSQQQSFHHEM